MPMGRFAGPAPAFDRPPQLYPPPEQRLPQPIDHDLFAALHALFHATLMAEHQRRANQPEEAVRRLDEPRPG